MKISVMIITYNRKREILRALESCVCNKIEEMEFVIVDNNSSDGTQEAVEKFFCENKKEEKVYSLLDEIHPMTFENLLENSGFSAFELQHILMKFELKNIIYQIEQNVYLRKV